MRLFYVTIPDKPIPLQRARASKNRFYDPQFEVKKRYAEYVLSHIEPKMELPIQKGVRLDFTFYMPMPASWSKKKKERMVLTPHLQQPDMDNCIKFFQDTLNKILYIDDSQIFYIEARKVWDYTGATSVTITEA